jgi:hypothetical protein
MTVGQQVDGDTTKNVILLNTTVLLNKDQLAAVQDLAHITDAMVLDM